MRSKWYLISACGLSTTVIAAMWFHLVFGVSVKIYHLLMPLLVGSGFGYLIAHILTLRSKLAVVNAQLTTMLSEKEEALYMTRASLVDAQRKGTLGDATAKVVHDFNNVLTVIMSATMLVKSHAGGEENEKALKHVIDAIQSGALLCRQVLEYGRDQDGLNETCCPDEVVERTSRLLELVVYGNNQLHWELAAKDVAVTVNPVRLQQLLMNLVVNARDALDGNGRIVIRTRVVPAGEDAAGVALEVEDNGHGMSPEVREQITRSYFSTKDEGKGTGLGMAVVADIVAASGGTLDIDSSEGVGTTVRIQFPQAA